MSFDFRTFGNAVMGAFSKTADVMRQEQALDKQRADEAKRFLFEATIQDHMYKKRQERQSVLDEKNIRMTSELHRADALYAAELQDNVNMFGSQSAAQELEQMSQSSDEMMAGKANALKSGLASLSNGETWDDEQMGQFYEIAGQDSPIALQAGRLNRINRDHRLATDHTRQQIESSKKYAEYMDSMILDLKARAKTYAHTGMGGMTVEDYHKLTDNNNNRRIQFSNTDAYRLYRAAQSKVTFSEAGAGDSKRIVPNFSALTQKEKDDFNYGRSMLDSFKELDQLAEIFFRFRSQPDMLLKSLRLLGLDGGPFQQFNLENELSASSESTDLDGYIAPRGGKKGGGKKDYDIGKRNKESTKGLEFRTLR